MITHLSVPNRHALRVLRELQRGNAEFTGPHRADDGRARYFTTTSVWTGMAFKALALRYSGTTH